MKTDGSEQVQITSDEFNNWFPHPSPDGKWIVFLSYEKDVKGHPENKDVMLRIISTSGGEIKVLAKLFGGQGTINVMVAGQQSLGICQLQINNTRIKKICGPESYEGFVYRRYRKYKYSSKPKSC
jgi:hypothetical protein